MVITCGLYSGRTFDATKLAIAETSPSRTEAPLELILQVSSLFNCMHNLKQMQRMIITGTQNGIAITEAN
jgi:hypothetical protein